MSREGWRWGWGTRMAVLVFGLLLCGEPAAIAQQPEPPTEAQPKRDPKAEFRIATNAFRFGNYEQAQKLLDGLLNPRVLLKNPDAVREALEILGVVAHLNGDLDKSREAFIRLVNLEPDRRLDPLIVPPRVIEFYDSLREEMAEKLAALRRRREMELAEAERAAREQGPRRLIVEQREVEKRPLLPHFMPFGTGQFINHRDGWGYFFLGSEALTLATSVTAYSLVELSRNPDGTHSGDARTRAVDVYQPLHVATGAAFLALWAWNVVDALMNRQAVTVQSSRREVELPPEVPTSTAEPGAAAATAADGEATPGESQPPVEP